MTQPNIRDLYVFVRVAAEEELDGASFSAVRLGEEAAAKRLVQCEIIERNPTAEHQIRVSALGKKFISGWIGTLKVLL